jgi:hypothetical protein
VPTEFLRNGTGTLEAEALRQRRAQYGALERVDDTAAAGAGRGLLGIRGAAVFAIERAIAVPVDVGHSATTDPDLRFQWIARARVLGRGWTTTACFCAAVTARCAHAAR